MTNDASPREVQEGRKGPGNPEQDAPYWVDGGGRVVPDCEDSPMSSDPPASGPGPLAYVGTAGWGIPGAARAHFPLGATGLERYAAVLNAVEINSSFYRPHKPATYARWAASVPDGFRFAVKMPRTITHHKRLASCEAEIARFAGEVAALGDRLGPLLVQLPPSLVYDERVAGAFFAMLADAFAGDVVCEPRHASWFTAQAGMFLAERRVARVAADPAGSIEAARPGGWSGIVYYRLHGSPRIYWSNYEPDALARLVDGIVQARTAGAQCWVIFDNTAGGAATPNALDLGEIVGTRRTVAGR
jgi:uncharacterized protein YecE (DUF72 family)